MNYLDFLKSKVVSAPSTGFRVDISQINPALQRHQPLAVQWALEGGRRALFESFGLGKTVQQLEWCHQVAKKESGRALITCPLGVKQEFFNDAVNLLGIRPPEYVRNMKEVRASESDTIITNYERVRDGDIDPKQFVAAGSLDEAAVLRSFGSKTYQEFLNLYRGVPYKIVCTAMPSPNRYKELIHYAGFLEVMDTGQALAQPLTSKILTPSGWVAMGDIKPGDQVVARNGKPTDVLGIYPQGEKEIFKVTFSDGVSTRCTAEHLWLTRTQYQRNAATKFSKRNPLLDDSHYWTIKDTSVIAQTLECDSTGSKNHQVPLVEPVEFPLRSVNVDPYLMGLLIGDGNLRKTSVNLTTADQWIVDHVKEIIATDGLCLRKNPHVRKDGQPNYDYNISAGSAGYTGRGNCSNAVLKGLRDYGLLEKRAWEKRIPTDYLFNTEDIRLSVLQGLMDADGTISSDLRNRTTRLCTTSAGLAEDVVFIAQSLGGTAQVRERQGRTPQGGKGRIQYVVTLRLPNGINPFRLPRKAELVISREKYTPKRYIVSIEPDGFEAAQCIAVADNDHLYVTDSFIVTHNTRFFQRDSTKANNLTLYPHKEDEFWLWVSTWALFITKPSDLGFSDEGYDLPPLDIRFHEVGANHLKAGFDRDGQGKLLRDAAEGLPAAAREKRDSLELRVSKATELVAEEPNDHVILWHDLEDERHALKRSIPDVVDIFGSQDLDEREKRTIDFSEGRIQRFATKKELSGAGSNFQKHCHWAIFVGIDHKFHDFLQAIHRIYRFLQVHKCRIDIIFTDSERSILDSLMKKWNQHNHMQAKMTEIIRKYGLNHSEIIDTMTRAIGVERVEIKKDGFYTAVNNDCVLETQRMEENSIDLIHTSIPFSNHYEYTPSYNDFGHNEDTARFFEQMDHLSPQLLRILKPGRVFACHVKDRVLFGNATGTGMPTIEPFHAICIDHYMKHGFQYFGMITVVTDVVRENNQTYRLGWSEQCKDGSKMGVGCPEYILLFRKLPSDTSTAYADMPVTKSKEDYTRAQWQIDAHAFWRSSGDRLLSKDEMAGIPIENLQRVYRDFSRGSVYSYDDHVELAKKLDVDGRLPATFMVVAPGSWTDEVWDDINRMRTLNMNQKQKGRQMHVCPLQLDIVERVINRYSNPGEVVFDPFGGIGTVPFMAIKAGRIGYMTELNSDYFRDAVGYLQAAEAEASMPTLFDMLEAV